MAERERKTGQNVIYEVLNEATGLSPNTLSTMAKGKVKMIGINTLEQLLDYFERAIEDLIVYEK